MAASVDKYFDFESEDNFIHFGATPHFTIQHELSIINKKELQVYIKARKKANEIRARSVREESSKF